MNPGTWWAYFFLALSKDFLITTRTFQCSFGENWILTHYRTDHGSTGVSSSSSKSYNAIDPNLIIVGSTPYLNFGSFWDDIFQVKMSSSLTSTAGSAPYNIEYDSAGTRPCEGSYMFYYGGYYYLLWSHGICCGYQTYVKSFSVSQANELGPFPLLVLNTWLWWHDRNLPLVDSSTRMVWQPRIAVDRSCSRVMIMFTALVDSELFYTFLLKWLT